MLFLMKLFAASSSFFLIEFYDVVGGKTQFNNKENLSRFKTQKTLCVFLHRFQYNEI